MRDENNTMEYKVNLEKFSGPLDILLSLIEEKRFVINDISLNQVTDQFLEYLKKIESDASSEYQRILADFLVVASRLILIKSRSLLPNLVLTQEEEGDIKELKEHLKAYQQIKLIGRELGKWIKTRNQYLGRDSYLNLPAMFYPPQNVSAVKFAEIYGMFLKTLPQIEKLEERSLVRVMTIEEKLKDLTERMGAAAEASFSEISGSTSLTTGGSVKEKIDIILTILAVLMLIRSRVLAASQDKLFGDIKIKKFI